MWQWWRRRRHSRVQKNVNKCIYYCPKCKRLMLCFAYISFSNTCEPTLWESQGAREWMSTTGQREKLTESTKESFVTWMMLFYYAHTCLPSSFMVCFCYCGIYHPHNPTQSNAAIDLLPYFWTNGTERDNPRQPHEMARGKEKTKRWEF